MQDWSSFSTLKGRSITRVSVYLARAGDMGPQQPIESFSEFTSLFLHTSDECWEVYAKVWPAGGWQEVGELYLRPGQANIALAPTVSADVQLHHIHRIRLFFAAAETRQVVHGVNLIGEGGRNLAIFAHVVPSCMTIVSSELSTRYDAESDIFALKSTMLDLKADIGFGELRQRFEAMAAQLPALQAQVDASLSRSDHSKGPYHELPLYSYQRAGIKRGQLIANPARIRSWDEVHITHFNAAGQIVRLDVGHALGQFDSDYVVQHAQGFFVYSFDEDEEPLSLTFYRVVDGRVQRALAHGQYGGSEETYRYDERGLLASIRVHRFSHNPAEEGSVNTEHFRHDEAGVLRRIELHHELGDVDVIFKA